MPRSNPATRGSNVTLTLGPLVSLPVTLFNRVATDSGVSKSEFRVSNGNPVGRAPIDKVTGELLDKADVVRKYNTEHGPVFVEDHEVEALFDLDANSITVIAYQPVDLFGTAYIPKQPMSIEPGVEKKGSKKVPSKAAQQGLTALFQILKEDNLLVLCEVVTRGTPKPAVILPDGNVWLVYNEEELREDRPAQPPVEVPESAVAQIRDLFVKPLVSKEPVTLSDTHSAAIQALADSKAEAGDFDAPEVPTLVETSTSTGDLMALLNASLATAGSVA